MDNNNGANPVDFQNLPNIDYYAVLNVSRTAPLEEIRTAYKRLAVTYHPDRQEPHLREEAKEKFTLIKTAYETLNDDRLRALYDKYGANGLKIGWELATKHQTAEEMLKEFEKMQAKADQAKLDARVGAKSQVTMALSLSDLRDSVSGELNPLDVTELSLQQSIKIPFSEQDMATISGTVKTQNGNGVGTLAGRYRRTFSNSSFGWTEVSTSGNVHYVQLGGWRRLSRFSTSQISADWHSRGGVNISTSIDRQLSQHVTGMFSWTVGSRSSMTFALARQGEKGTIRGDWTLTPNDTTLAVSYTRLLSSRTTFKLSAEYSIFSRTPQVVVGISREITKLSKLGMSVVMQQEALLLNLSYSRASHKFVFPLLIANELTLPNTLGTLFGATFFAMLMKYLILEPHKRRKKKKKLEKLKKESATLVAIAKKHAESTIQLMLPTVQRKIQLEQGKRGLVIVYARYGNLEKDGKEESDIAPKKDEELAVIDVTVPLQNLVEESKLYLHSGSKASMLGFYDPCVGEDKQLYIRYLFKDKLHEVIIDDEDAVRLPLESHRIKANN